MRGGRPSGRSTDPNLFMETPRKGQAGGNAPRGVALKPRLAGLAAEFDSSLEAQRLAVLEADEALVNRLMWQQYAGPEWKMFVEALAEYGVQVMRSWVRTGRVFERCRAKRVRGIGSLRIFPREDDDACEIADETVALAIVAFREKVLIPRKWTPTKHATLNTYFIGQCLFQFPEVYRVWANHTHGPATQNRLLTAADAHLVQVPFGRPDRVVEFRRLWPLLGEHDPRRLEALVEMGGTQSEIANLVGLTLKAVELKLYHHRRQGAVL